MMRREPKPAARLAARHRLGEGAAPEALGRDRVVERAQPHRLVGRAPLRLRVEVHHAAGQREALHREAARLDRHGARRLARHAAAVHQPDPPRHFSGLGLEVHAGQRGELGAVGEEGQVLRRRGCPPRSARPWSRPRTPGPCPPAAAPPAPRAPAARRPGTTAMRRDAGRRERTAAALGDASRRFYAWAAARGNRAPCPPPRGEGARGLSGRCWRRNCSISATRSPAGGSSSLISATSDGSIASAGAGGSSSSSPLLRSSLRTYSAIFAFCATIEARFCSNCSAASREVGEVRLGVQQGQHAPDEGQGRPRILDAGDVVRHVRPQAGRRHARLAAEGVEHAHDAGRALVARRPEAQARGQLGIVGAARQPDGPGVGHLGEQRAQGEDQRGPGAPGQLEHRRAVGAPLEMRLDGDPDDDVALELGGLGEGELGGRPDDLALGPGAGLEAHVGAGEAEVVKLFRVDAGERPRRPELAQVAGGGGGGLGRVVPARERHDDDGPAQLPRLLVERQVLAHRRRSLLWSMPEPPGARKRKSRRNES